MSINAWFASFLVVACVTIARPSFGQQSTSCPPQHEIQLFYANGVLVNDPSDAIASAQSVADALQGSSHAQFSCGVDTAIAWNPSLSVANDLIESIAQRANFFDYVKIAAYLYTASLVVPELDAAWGYFFLQITLSDVTNATPQVLANHVAAYRGAIAAGKKVLVLAHSQGNFFANAAYDQLTTTERLSFAIVGVANPDNRVGGGDRFFSFQTWITDKNDDVVNAVRSQKSDTLAGNVDNGFVVSTRGFRNHGFNEFYFSPIANSRTKIIDTLASAAGLFPAYTVSGTVSGLAGSGLVLTLNGFGPLTINSNGTFSLGVKLASGSTYIVAVATQPTNPTQVCQVSNGSGLVASANITNVLVSCSTPVATYTLGGTITGLQGTGLVLRSNVIGVADLPIVANGTFAFNTSLTTGTGYSVNIVTQPSSPSQACAVTNGAGFVGSANVTNVVVTCTTVASTFSIGGSVSGLTGSGLVLALNLGSNLTINSNGPFSFATRIASGGTYSVVVGAQPTNPGQLCQVSNASGVVANANVTSVSVTCTQVNGIVYDIDAGVPSSDQSDISSGIALAQQFFQAAFGKIVTGTVTVHIKNVVGQYAAFASGSDITINVQNPVWTSTASINREKIAVHELFHIFQNVYGFASNPGWFIEGSAEYVGFQGIAYGGLLPYSTARRCQIYSMAHFVDPTFTLQTGTGIPPNGGYWLAFMGIDYMSSSNIGTFANIVNQPTSAWDAKMAPVVGLNASQYYSNFEAQRPSYPVPTTYECPP